MISTTTAFSLAQVKKPSRARSKRCVVGKIGFAYGTLPKHVERGEECFSVEWHHADDTVWYDILAFSRPKHILVRLGYPVARALQARFVRDSMQALLKATSNS